MATERNYAGRSAQERRGTRRRALLDAGLELIGTQGWTQTSVRGVYQLAGVSPRFFYESFEDLDALAVAVYDEIVGEATANVIAAVSVAGSDRHDQAEAAMRAVVDGLTEDPAAGASCSSRHSAARRSRGGDEGPCASSPA